MINFEYLQRNRAPLSLLRLFSTFVVISLLVLPARALAAADAKPPNVVRFATFNASLNRNFAGQLVSDLSTPRQCSGEDCG